MKTASIIMAAGRGSRMKDYNGNKTLLPLITDDSPFYGRRPILRHIIENLPRGPKTIVVNYQKEAVINAMDSMGLCFCDQPVLNGTGGALLAAEDFIRQSDCENIIITMGDVPFIQPGTYRRLVDRLSDTQMVVLGFSPDDKKKYGLLEINGTGISKITEWKYWKDYAPEKQRALSVCNSGIYAVTKTALVPYLAILSQRPQIVVKEVNGVSTQIKEFFITDLVEYMVADGLSIGYIMAEDETETMGVDDLDALLKAQKIYKKQNN
jgi:bifunctional UDP-N-acetylglucosamine pyrophosphorylase/glucosamine-1-phosphate N-acetyltransferase